MPPKGAGKKKIAGAADVGEPATHIPSLAEQLSYQHAPRPFKSATYTRNVSRRPKNLKAVLGAERERERAERNERLERAKARQLEPMEVDGSEETTGASATAATTTTTNPRIEQEEEDLPTYSSIEAPLSLLPQRRYCDITGLEAHYTDPATELRYHDKSVYELIKGLSTSAAKEYLSARGVNPVVR